MPFVDTNILVYARDSSDPVKQVCADEVMRVLWRKRTGRLSPQVLQEYYATVTRKLKPGIAPSEARQDIRDLLAWGPKQVTTSILESAWEIEDGVGLSWWDSLIVASALDCGATSLLTEDMQDGLAIRSLQIVNPFSEKFDKNRLRVL
ncbi:MAG: PIN domain-containing protein [Terrimicrobiaceae bacterium]|jgi:predicted nucleic acid-binding protein|nr:PIN domain-containing protein [Terrimicrobiaceae bacterium]